MYLNISSEKTLRSRDVIGIFDMDTATVAPETKKFLQHAQRQNKLSGTSDIPQSFILTGGKVYLSRISPVSLKKRLEK